MATKSLETDKLTKALAEIPGIPPVITQVFTYYLSIYERGILEIRIPGLTLEMMGRLLSDFAGFCADYTHDAGPDPKAEGWAEKNQWFGKNDTMTLRAFSIHMELVSEGYDTESDTYYAEIDKRLKADFPQYLANEQ